MSDKVPDSDQQKDIARRRMPDLLNIFKGRDERRSQPHQFRTLFHPRSTSRLSHRGKSPDRKNEKAENAQLTASTYTSVAPLEAKLDDNKDAQPSAKTAQLGAKTAAAGSNKDNDVWTIAEEKLRRDPQKCEKLKEYDGILKKHFGSTLEPIGTPERREQFLRFLNLETESLNRIDSETQLRRCSNKAKRFFKSAVDCVIASKDIITAAATPCLPASVACVGVTVLLSLCVQAADQRHIFFGGLNAISGSIHRLAEYEALLSKDGNQQTEEVKVSITTACCNIIEFQARAACFLQNNPIESAIRNVFKRDGWDELLSEIKKAEARVKDCAERKSMNEISKIFDKFDELKSEIGNRFSKLAETQEAIDRKQRVDIFLQLLYSNACFYEDSKNRNRERVTGTCDWFTDHEKFKKWNLPIKSLHETPGLLYVTADPGCGKSVLSRYLIDQILPDDGRTVCYFFFKDDFENQKSSLSALCTFLHQFFIPNPHLLTDTILDKHGAYGEKFVESFPELWKTFLDAAGCRETVCVLDALDECRDSDRRQLIDAIIGTKVPGLKFLLTSRPYQHIHREFLLRLKAQMPSIHLQGDCKPTANAIEQEIKLVVESRIDETAESFCLEPDERRLLKKQLESVRNRTYLWITLVFDGLMEKKSSITKKDIMNLTKRLPQGVYDAYEKILKKSRDRERSKRVLHLILGAKRPLSLSEMSVALAFNGQQSWDDVAEDIISENRIQDTLRDLCGLFVTVVDKRVYLLHQTAREFLVRDFSNKKKAKSGHFGGPGNYDAAVIIFISQGLTFIFAVLFSIMQPIFHRIWLFLTNSWQHSMDLTYSNSVLAETCISCLQPDFVKENDSMFEYSAIYWADHYHQSVENFKVAAAGKTRALCLLEPRKQWTKIYAEHNDIPVTESPLCLASALGLERVVKMFLLEQDSIGVELQNDVDSKDDRYSQTPLSWAAKNGHEAVVKLLLDTGKVDVDSKDRYWETPLSWAAKNGHEAVVKLLLDTGKVDVDSKDRYWETPLSWAAKNGYEAVVKLLLDTGKVDVDSKDRYWETPLSWAAKNGHEAVVKLLLDTGKVDVDSKDEYWETPLSLAAGNGHEAVVKLLLDTGKVDVDSKDGYSRTPLSQAAGNGHEAVVKLLLDTGKVDVDSKDDRYSRTPLSWAAGNGHEAVVKLLLDTGKVDVGSKDDRYSRTPLSWAADNGHKAVVKLLESFSTSSPPTTFIT